jgi:hypothetical protein
MRGLGPCDVGSNPTSETKKNVVKKQQVEKRLQVVQKSV